MALPTKGYIRRTTQKHVWTPFSPVLTSTPAMEGRSSAVPVIRKVPAETPSASRRATIFASEQHSFASVAISVICQFGEVGRWAVEATDCWAFYIERKPSCSNGNEAPPPKRRPTFTTRRVWMWRSPAFKAAAAKLASPPNTGTALDITFKASPACTTLASEKGFKEGKHI